MTYDQMKELTTQLLNGYALGTDEFNRLLHFAQAKYESLRDWMILKSLDTSQTITPSTIYTTPKSLPSDFMRFLSDRPIVLVGSTAGDEIECVEIPLEKRERHRFDFGKFYVDYKNSAISFTGTPNGSYTVNQFYLYKPSDISNIVSWVFPSWCHALLPYDIAVNYKGGIDYDSISESQARYNQQQIDQILERMVLWDAKMQASQLEGLDRYYHRERPWMGGRVDING